MKILVFILVICLPAIVQVILFRGEDEKLKRK
jgi:hypothetical protein